MSYTLRDLIRTYPTLRVTDLHGRPLHEEEIERLADYPAREWTEPWIDPRHRVSLTEPKSGKESHFVYLVPPENGK